MEDIRRNEGKDGTIWQNKSPVKMDQNDDSILNKNYLPSNRSSKVTTKISKLIYDPPNQSNRPIIKTTHTYGHKVTTTIPTDSSQQLDSDKLKTSKFKPRDINKFPEKKSNESADNIANPINKNNEFLKKKLEREKDIEDIQKMLNQINTSSHENDNAEYKNSIDNNLKLNNKIETNQKLAVPENSQTELQLNLNNMNNKCDINNSTINSNEVVKLNTKNMKNIEKNDLLQPSESDLNLRRSQTDMNLKTKFLLSPHKPMNSSRTGTIRSKSSINLISRNTSKVSIETTTPKKKSYDPNEARQFMKQQRLKRKQIKTDNTSQNKTNVSSIVDKEAIKKRLEELRKSTLKILEKNVKKIEKQKIKKIDNNNDDETSNPNTVRSNKTILKPLNTKGILKLDKPNKKNIEKNDEIINKKIGILRKPETDEHSFSVLKDINKENLVFDINTPNLREIQQNDQNGFKKITDTILFKKPIESIFENNNNKDLDLDKNDNDSRTNIKQIKSTSTKTDETEINKKANENDLKLKIPDKKLERKVSLREKSIQVDPQSSSSNTNSKQNDLPYWLKPTPVQYYPYNFIMAVRKKLEAITNPVITDNNKYKKDVSRQNSNNNVIKKSQETPLTYPKERKQTVRRRIIDEKNFHLNANDSVEQNMNMEKQINSNSNVKIEKNDKCKNVKNDKDSISELTSNFSSISIHVPESHTISDISSIRSELASKENSKKSIINNSKKISDNQNLKIINKFNFIHEDDTTISSSVFSSPEKKIKKQNPSNELINNIDIELNTGSLSPLSIDNINKLQIKSKSNLDKVNLERGTGSNLDMPKLQLTSKTKLEIPKQKKKDNSNSKSHSSRSHLKSENLDFSQLLEDFNKSLSQVIEVNEQLKETLKKSNQMLSPNKKNRENIVAGRTQVETENYTSDFEKEISHTQKGNSVKPYNDLNKQLKAGSIQSKTDEYTSDFEEEPNSTENVTTAKSETVLSIPQKTSLTNITEKLQSISSNKNINEKFDKNNDNNSEIVKEISTNQSQITNTTQEFLDSIEEISKIKTSTISEHITESINKNNEIIDNVIIEEENSIKKNQSPLIYQISKNSFDHFDNSNSQSKNEFIKSHINNSRGDFNEIEQNDDIKSNKSTGLIESNRGPPPAYMIPDNIQAKETTNSSICSEFIAVFNRSDVALSIYSQNESTSCISEATLNYSTIGMYEQLLQTETSKSDQLAALLKMREKALMDRTRGQIAWLEVQKQKYKTKGLSGQISHIKKKQRAILMKMEKEREEIKKLIQNQQPQLSARSTIASDRQSQQQQQKIRSYHPKLVENISDISIRKNLTKKYSNQNNNNTNPSTTNTTIKSSNKIIRGFEIQTNPNLEIILQKREEELRKRRAHVECLMEWHQRLDKEEEEVLQLERILFEHNTIPQNQHKFKSNLDSQEQQYQQLKKEKKIFEINKSLRELQNISARSTNSIDNQNPDYVRTTGNKLNKLWRRLTGQKDCEKFEINKKYKLYKIDLEKLYEDAKDEVLKEFENQHEIMDLFEQTKSLETTGNSLNSNSQILVPRLNLNFSSGQSDVEHTNCSSVFYESTIQKQLQSIDLLDNIEEDSISKSNNLINDILSSQVNNQSEHITKIDSEKSEKCNKNENLNFEINEFENSLINNEVFDQMIDENIELVKIDNKIIPEDPIESDSATSNTAEKVNSTEENNTFNSKIQITKITDISDIGENKTSDDITSLSLEEQNQSFENSKSVIIDSNSSQNLKLNLSIEIPSTSSVKIQSNIEKSEDKSIDDEISSTKQNNDISNNDERITVIVSPILSNENPSENVNKSPDTEINLDMNTETLNGTEATLEPLITSSIEEIVKFSIERSSDISKCSEKVCKEIVEKSENLESIDTNADDNSNILSKCSSSKSDLIKSEREQNDGNIVSPEKSINSENYESPTLIYNSPHCITNETFVLSIQNLTSSPISTNSTIPTLSQIEPQKIIEETEEYENDFSGSDMTFLEDITAPKFETTIDDTKSNFEESNLDDENQSIDEKSNSTTELEKRLIDLDVSLKDLHSTFDRALSPDKNSIKSPPLLSPPLPIISNKSSPPNDTNIKLDLDKNKFSLSPPRNYVTNNENPTTLMPDIINEVELRRRQQILIESEIKQLEQTAVPPYVFLREIPNKPPPPYVPPAHGSPMTIIFPSEQRIKEITFRRTKELYDEILKTDNITDKNDSINSTPITITKSISILDENITNIYERIILDICKECMDEYKEILTNLNPETYKNSLALYNPPNRLKCMQEFVYRNVKKLLAMEKKSNIFQKNSIISIGRKKRDHVDEILIQELYEEEHKWTNFDQEEEEVKLAIVDEILNDIVKDVIGEITDINQKKLEFLTNYSTINLNNE